MSMEFLRRRSSHYPWMDILTIYIFKNHYIMSRDVCSAKTEVCASDAARRNEAKHAVFLAKSMSCGVQTSVLISWFGNWFICASCFCLKFSYWKKAGGSKVWDSLTVSEVRSVKTHSAVACTEPSHPMLLAKQSPVSVHHLNMPACHSNWINIHDTTYFKAAKQMFLFFFFFF